MKKMFSALLCMFMLISMTPASADYQETFELSCTRKTDAAAVIYNTCEDNAAPIDRIDYGTYVQVLDYGMGDWVEIIYMEKGIQYHGWTNAPLVKCVTLLVDENGHMTEIHELDPEYLSKVFNAQELMEDEF